MNGTILLTVFLIVGSGELKRTITHASSSVFHPILAGFIVGVGLFIFAIINSNLAQKACWLLIAFALIVNGAGIASTLSNPRIAGTAKPVTPANPIPAGGGATTGSAGTRDTKTF